MQIPIWQIARDKFVEELPKALVGLLVPKPALEQIRSELDAKLARLVEISNRPKDAIKASSPSTSSVRRPPRRFARRTLDVLFYLFASLSVFMVLGLFFDREQDPDWPVDLLAVLVYVIPAYLFRAWAKRLRAKNS